MANGVSAYAAAKFLNWIKGTGAGTAPTAIYVALFTGDPEGAGTEVTTTVRAGGRLAVTFGSIASKAMSNSADVDFGDSAGDVSVDYTALYDASTSGNMIGSAALAAERDISTGDPVKFSTGDLVYDLSTP